MAASDYENPTPEIIESPRRRRRKRKSSLADRKCPSCGRHRVFGAHRQVLEFLLLPLLLRPLHCRNCRRRHYGFFFLRWPAIDANHLQIVCWILFAVGSFLLVAWFLFSGLETVI